MPTMQTFTIFKGDSLNVEATYRQKDGANVDLATAGITISAYLKGRDNKKFPISVEILPQTGKFRLTSATNEWPLGRNQLVIRYLQAGTTRTAEPVTVLVEDV